jgi:predicted nucleic acid-binding protein
VSVISNTTVISNFASIGQLDILHHLYRTLHISTEVYEEIQTGLEEGYRFYEGIDQQVHPLADEGWIRLTSVTGESELRTFSSLPARLHYGEASCIAIALNRGWFFLTDDIIARRHALQLGIRVSGSVGCLVQAVERGLCKLEQANGWLQQMVKQGYRSPVCDLTSLLKNESGA